MEDPVDAFKWLRLPFRLVSRSGFLPILSGPGRGFRWRVGSSLLRVWFGRYDPGLIKAAVAQVRGGVVFDLGAHAGYYTLALVRSAAHVHAFEPCAEDLIAHVRANHLEARVTVHPVAVSEVSGQGRLTGEDSNRHLSDYGRVVALVALDDLDLPDPTFIKIDVEGHEAAALRGMRRLLTRAHPTLLIELHSEEARRETLHELAGYTIDWIKPPNTLLATWPQ